MLLFDFNKPGEADFIYSLKREAKLRFLLLFCFRRRWIFVFKQGVHPDWTRRSGQLVSHGVLVSLLSRRGVHPQHPLVRSLGFRSRRWLSVPESPWHLPKPSPPRPCVLTLTGPVFPWRISNRPTSDDRAPFQNPGCLRATVRITMAKSCSNSNRRYKHAWMVHLGIQNTNIK